ncbi:mannan endo-1,4-beta-mannosidase [Paenibacillus endophyticus]|uniref:Mannan endo-1,4-beta-mannosidase n=1 Tax=Paenibacillus endophyticus TaxID=1294268 RepID=A0A7W5GAY1_9BACL|nr:glycosyl hydrolase [Paenibacillus endophyticus]MBB3153221.1 mannan endo-1,4-beta-mannosidase [Paenibacillus endophyticus]
MKKVRKWVAGAIAPMLVLSLAMPVIAQTKTTDTQGHWAQAAIERWQSNGVINGYSDGSFRPNRTINRAELVTIINASLGFRSQSEQPFSDVAASAWYAEAVSAAREAGYFEGYPSNVAKPLDAVTRQDAVVLLAKAFHLKAVGSASFKDEADIAVYAKEAVDALSSVLEGYGDGSFKPRNPLTRAELVAVIDKLVAGYYPKAGEFAGGSIAGNVVVNQADVVLKDMTINGNLYVTAAVADGDAKLVNVTVNGETYVWGGGENTVSFDHSALAGVEVERKDGPVRVHFSQGSSAQRVTANGIFTLELDADTGVGELTLRAGAQGSAIKGLGDVKKAVVQADDVKLNGANLPKGEAAIKDGKAVNASSGGTGSGGSGGDNGGGSAERVENLVDPDATAFTKSLFAYLDDVRGQQMLFGQQHVTTEGISFINTTETQSDVKKAVGDFPAVFGWDTGSLEGKEKPGVTGDTEQSRINLAAKMKEAHELGGIVALSTHFPNFVTGGGFNDTAGSVVQHILPGGDKNSEFNAYLDLIAELANNLKDDNGELIPILFRPFHEQNGGWFWWGAKTTTVSEYIEIYRYTVEYLRDKKNVHSLLYVYSPNGAFSGSEDTYLTTYPGDDYVDILGMDQYDNQQNPGSDTFLSLLVNDLAMISRLADSKGKIATFSEFGYSPQGMLTQGNVDLNWFTKVLAAIKADPDARRISYMQTWANFHLNGNLFVPYRDAPALGDHELLDDLVAFYNDPYTAFAAEVGDVYGMQVRAAEEKPSLHIVSPVDQSTVKETDTLIRARVLHAAPSKVVYVAEGSASEIPMSLDEDGYYSASWSPAGEQNGKTASVTVKVYKQGGVVLEQSVLAFVKVDELPLRSYTFDEQINGIQNNGTWPAAMGLSLAHALIGGNGMLQLNVTGAVPGDNWQEFKLELTDAATAVPLASVNRVKWDVWIPASAGAAGANASLRTVVMLPPDWSDEGKYGMLTTEEKLSELDTVTIDGVAYARYTAVVNLNDAAKSAEATSIALSLIGSGLQLDGPIYVDNIELISSYFEAPIIPSLVDDFEGYQGVNAALQAKFVKAGGDTVVVSLDPSHESGGEYAMRFDYTLGGSGYAGITKGLGGVDWSAFNKLKFWIVPDGSNQKLVIQLRVDGVSYEAYPSLAGTTGEWVSLHFNEFAVAPWDTGNAGKKINKASLKNVQDFNIYVNAVSGAMLSSSLYFDDIEAINDGGGGVPNGGNGAGSTPSPAGVLYDFESETSGFNVESNEASAMAPAITADAATSGTHSLSASFSLAGTGFELAKVSALDLSAVDAVSAKVKLSAGTANVRLYMKTGAGWSWYDSGTAVSVDSTEFKTLYIPLNGIADRDAVKAIGIKIEPTDGSGEAFVYMDEITLNVS